MHADKTSGTEAVLALIAARPDLFTRQGAVLDTWHRAGTAGPYYRLGHREAGRQRAVCLGREGPGVDAVRRAPPQATGVSAGPPPGGRRTTDPSGRPGGPLAPPRTATARRRDPRLANHAAENQALTKRNVVQQTAPN
jgi:hypothetical protein